MSKPKILIFAPREEPPEAIKVLEGLGCEVVIGDRDWQLPRHHYEDTIVEAARDTVALMGTSIRHTPISRRIMQASQRLRVVAKYTVGVDDIDTEAATELGIMVHDDVTIRGHFGEGLAELLDDPFRSRVSNHAEVQNFPASVFNDEEAVQHLEGHRGYGEEVERSDHLPVIPEEGQPSFAGITAAPNTLQIPGYGSLGDIEAQFLEFSMDLGCSPGRILFGQAADECPRISAVILGRPAGARDCHFQKSRNPARCQPTTVSGLTATKTSAHRDQTQRRIIQNSRSN